MRRIAGVLILLVGLYAWLLIRKPSALSDSTFQSLFTQQGYYGILTIGVGLLIISGGIDLSIGSVIGLSSVSFVLLIRDGCSPNEALLLCLGIGALIGLIHGLLITQLGLQPFLVTLCGLFIYRGIARRLTNETVNRSVINRNLSPEEQAIVADRLDALNYWLMGIDPDGLRLQPGTFFVLIGVALVLGFLLHASVYGRYWYAIGYNEQAAKYAGIAIARQRILLYMICSTLAAFGGVLFFLDNDTANPATAGEFYELYAITGAVLGGCSLRGGEGTMIGMVLGAMVLPLLRKLMVIQNISDPIVPVIIGLTLLFGTIADEFFRRSSGPGKAQKTETAAK